MGHSCSIFGSIRSSFSSQKLCPIFYFLSSPFLRRSCARINIYMYPKQTPLWMDTGEWCTVRFNRLYSKIYKLHTSNPQHCNRLQQVLLDHWLLLLYQQPRAASSKLSGTQSEQLLFFDLLWIPSPWTLLFATQEANPIT